MRDTKKASAGARGVRVLGRIAACATVVAVCAPSALARMKVANDPLTLGFTPIAFISPANIAQQMVDAARSKELIAHFCKSVFEHYKKFKWTDEPCGGVAWKADLSSKNGHPLIYAEFGDGEETTLLLGGVHPDEITPVPMAFRMARHLTANPSMIDKSMRVIVAPLVNPDGFLRNLPTRTNGNGIDLNRNFFTLDWYNKAKQLWTQRRQRTPKHFPGYFPNSEIETIFQIQLIDRFKPDKILSIHAPLGFLDYDGPGDGLPKRQLSGAEGRAKQLVLSISEKAQNYRVVDYGFYPGSLGNYAGNERQIPTVTLELETTEPSMVETYWRQFLPGMVQSIHYRFKLDPSRAEGLNATPFSKEYAQSEKPVISPSGG